MAVLKSGVHATLAGVLIAFCVPMRDEAGKSPLRTLEHDLHGPVAFAILSILKGEIKPGVSAAVHEPQQVKNWLTKLSDLGENIACRNHLDT